VAEGSSDLTDDASGAAEVSGAAGGRSVRMQIPGQIQSRDDVVEALDKICSYYERHEQSSPVPLLLRRAKRLATMSFMDIIKDLADQALPQVEVISGKSDEEQVSES
jgi:type VI secretion system protein ImpA